MFLELSEVQAKLLFKMVAANEAHLDLEKGLTPYGIQILHELQSAIGEEVVGVGLEGGGSIVHDDWCDGTGSSASGACCRSATQRVTPNYCESCGQAMLMHKV